jgi:deoxycitidine kinase/deoxyguanosine kinase
MSEHTDSIIITERSLYTDKCVFAKMLYDSKHIEDVSYQIYLKWFDEFSKDFPVDQVIYVRAYPETCHERIKTRSRTGESTISLDYLQDCHKYHDDFMSQLNCSINTLDGNINIFEEERTFQKWLTLIDDIIMYHMYDISDKMKDPIFENESF